MRKFTAMIAMLLVAGCATAPANAEVRMMNTTRIAIVAIVSFHAVAASFAGFALQPAGSAGTAAPVTAQAGDVVRGEIRKIDREAGKLTIRHGEIRNLGMSAMTMVFQAAKPEMLDAVRVGDQVNFTATSDNGKLMVTTLERVP